MNIILRNSIVLFLLASYSVRPNSGIDLVGDGVKYDTAYKVQLDKLGNFVDNYGRVCFYHGINSVQKSFPWYPISLLNETQLKLYQDWGFNAVRLGTMWSGVMPQRGTFNETYLMIQEKILNLLAKYGMFAYLDMHQDVISSRYGSYDGVPRWLIDSFPQAPHSLDYPWPLKNSSIIKNWAEGYLTYSVGNAFQHLYSNTSSSWTYWGQFWAKLATKFGKRNNVMGFELINEPWAGNIYLNPERILPGYAGSHNLLPAYDHLTNIIRTIDKDTLLFYEPVTWGVYDFSNGTLGSGFDRVPGGSSQAQKSVLSYHYYCWILQGPVTPDQPYPHWAELVCDDVLLKRVFKETEKDIKLTGGARFLTEFGVCAPDNSSKSVNTIECEEVMRQADENLQSWTYWDAQFFDPSGNIYWNRVKAFSRTYPRAVAGIPISLSFDVNSSEFSFSYKLNNTFKVPTEIFVPLKVHYQNGFNLHIAPKMNSTLHESNQILEITPVKNEQYSTDTIVTVQITKK